MDGEAREHSAAWWDAVKGEPGVTPEHVWTFRGYKLKASEFTTAMVHFFRAEVHRANVWRQRLDTTTNWAVITTGATISISFSQGMNSHSVIILNTLLVTLFLFIEARRYRFYEVWSARVRLLETDFFAAMLVPPFQPAADWAESLAENLLQPHFTISMWEAIGRRYRRNYLWIYGIMVIAWVAHVWLHPVPITSWADFLNNAAMGPLPGWLVLAIGAVFNLLLLAMGVLTMGLQQASGEILPRFGAFPLRMGLDRAVGMGKVRDWRAWFRPSFRREQFLALVITDHAEAIARRVLSELRRGMTALSGTGMYTGQPRSVLLCALTASEVPGLRAVLHQEDPKAFLIVSPAREILGSGFMPLKQEAEAKGKR